MNDELLLDVAREADQARLADVLSHAFGFPREDAGAWFGRAGPENVRALRRGEAVIGGLLEVPMGQWFGGRSVPTLGLAGVGITPAERGRGVGSWLMRETLRQARARGFALSTLYPATLTLYRRAGYERAGAFAVVSFDPRTIEVAREPSISVDEVVGVPEPLRALYDRVASQAPGHLDRGAYVWGRVVAPRGLTTRTFTLAPPRGALEGYVVVAQTSSGSSTTITVADLVVTTARAARASLRLLAEYRSLATQVKYNGALSDLVTTLLPERHFAIDVSSHFMVRVVDVARALEARGFPTAAAGAITLEVADDVLPDNAGRWSVVVEGGRARVGRARGALHRTGSAARARARRRARGGRRDDGRARGVVRGTLSHLPGLLLRTVG